MAVSETNSTRGIAEIEAETKRNSVAPMNTANRGDPPAQKQLRFPPEAKVSKDETKTHFRQADPEILHQWLTKT